MGTPVSWSTPFGTAGSGSSFGEIADREARRVRP